MKSRVWLVFGSRIRLKSLSLLCRSLGTMLNSGVEPDIEVDNDPKSVIQGRDPQLERAIREIMKRIEAEPKRLPYRPADPVKTG